MVLAAVSNSGLSLQYASAELKNNKKITDYVIYNECKEKLVIQENNWMIENMPSNNIKSKARKF